VHATVECWLEDQSDYPWPRDGFGLPAPREVIRESDAGRLACRLRAALRTARPDVVLLYGDLPVTLLAMSAAHGLGIPSVHIGAGYRSGDLSDTEELIRIAADHGVQHRIAFSRWMVDNLSREQVPLETISMYGNPMLQAIAARMARYQGTFGEAAEGLATFHHNDNLLDSSRIGSWLDHIELLASRYSLTVVLYRSTAAALRRFGLLDRLTSIATGNGRTSLCSALPYEQYVRRLLGCSLSSPTHPRCRTSARSYGNPAS
jgi:UDP-N-acetylglucosamine 2-epimerase